MFAVWLVVVDQRFVTSDSATDKGISLLMILAQKVIKRVETVVPVPFLGLFWNPPCTNFTEMTFVVDNVVGRSMTDPQLVCHFIDCHPPVVEN
jgi:hypothetical protein